MSNSNNSESLLERIESYGWHVVFSSFRLSALRMSRNGDTLMVQMDYNGSHYDECLNRLYLKIQHLNEFFAV